MALWIRISGRADFSDFAAAIDFDHAKTAGGNAARYRAGGGAGSRLELGEALRTRSFWLLSIAYFIYAFVAGSMVVHVIVHLIGVGYQPAVAALTMSLIFLCASAGKIGFGILADRVGSRIALLIDFLLEAFGIVLALGAQSPVLLLLFAVLFGFTFEAQLALCPLVTAESLGLKRYGSISGVLFVFVTSGAAIGPVVTGWIFDVTHGYRDASFLFIVLLVAGGVASLGCMSLSIEQARFRGRRNRVRHLRYRLPHPRNVSGEAAMAEKFLDRWINISGIRTHYLTNGNGAAVILLTADFLGALRAKKTGIRISMYWLMPGSVFMHRDHRVGGNRQTGRLPYDRRQNPTRRGLYRRALPVPGLPDRQCTGSEFGPRHRKRSRRSRRSAHSGEIRGPARPGIGRPESAHCYRRGLHSRGHS